MNAYQKEFDMSEDEYEDVLRELYYEDVTICGQSFDQAHAFRELDPVAFRCAMSDYMSEQDDTMPWVCAECENEFDDEDEANECCTKSYEESHDEREDGHNED